MPRNRERGKAALQTGTKFDFNFRQLSGPACMLLNGRGHLLQHLLLCRRPLDCTHLIPFRPPPEVCSQRTRLVLRKPAAARHTPSPSLALPAPPASTRSAACSTGHSRSMMRVRQWRACCPSPSACSSHLAWSTLRGQPSSRMVRGGGHGRWPATACWVASLCSCLTTSLLVVCWTVSWTCAE